VNIIIEEYHLVVQPGSIEQAVANSGAEIFHLAYNWLNMPCSIQRPGPLTVYTVKFDEPKLTVEVLDYLEKKWWRACKYNKLALLAPQVLSGIEDSPIVALNSVWQDVNRYYASIFRKVNGLYAFDLESNGGVWPASTRFLCEPVIVKPQ